MKDSFFCSIEFFILFILMQRKALLTKAAAFKTQRTIKDNGKTYHKSLIWLRLKAALVLVFQSNMIYYISYSIFMKR